MYKRKMNMTSEVYIISVSGYIGYTTRSEIEYSKQAGEPVEYMSN